ncbi:unnamed protein product [Notodromas monacha]|uniref:DM domain-containing protein n=1 Tax=Notodromas monacha TaxID=399045 RepID=A0A7R9BQ94_9CRUS|nr:unnamed protein product [Notodromas monacha]CAG0919648.1 unnamed protein product [Notodromas monacha]
MDPWNEPASDSAAGKVSTRSPECARCRNHGSVNKIKGHKNYCEHRFCPCVRCEQTVDRQRVMAKQISRRRAATAALKYEAAAAEARNVPGPSTRVLPNPPVLTDEESSGPISDRDRQILLMMALQKYSLDYEGLLLLVAIQKVLMNVEETDREVNAALVEFDVLVEEGKACDVDLCPEPSPADVSAIPGPSALTSAVSPERSMPNYAAFMAQIMHAQLAMMTAAAAAAAASSSSSKGDSD